MNEHDREREYDQVDPAHEPRSGYGPAAVILALVAGIAQLAAALSLLIDHWGWHWALAIIVLAVLLIARASLLIVVGALLGAWWAWDWPFLGALAFAMPGLVLALMVTLGGGLRAFFSKFGLGRRK